jgi:hypothetical protein
VGLGDPAFFVDHVGDPASVLVRRGITRAVGQTDFPLRVAKQREWKLELLREGFVLLRCIEARAEDLCVFRFVFGGEVPEPGTLFRSAGGVGFRVEPEHDLLPTQIGQAHAIPVVVHDVEIRSFLARLKHFAPPTKGHLKDAAQ